jgi:hypothetical protein
MYILVYILLYISMLFTLSDFLLVTLLFKTIYKSQVFFIEVDQFQLVLRFHHFVVYPFELLREFYIEK